MAENKTEYFLSNINQKLKHRNTFAWKLWVGYLIAFPLFMLGALIMDLGRETKGVPATGLPLLFGIIFVLAGIMWIIINIVLALIALYRSTKDYK